VPVPVVAIVSIGDAFLRVGRSRRMAWSYRLQPLREPAAKILDRDDVLSPVSFSPLQPRHTVSVRALSSSSSSSSIRVSFIPDNSTGASFLGGLPVGMKLGSLCVALSVVPRWARFYPCFCENCPRARSGCSSIQRFVRHRHGGENNDCQRTRWIEAASGSPPVYLPVTLRKV